jgi:hypothetical protein
VPNEPPRVLLWHAAAVLAGTLLMTWPALFNRYPLLYPDSMTYVADGRLVARALFLHDLSGYYGMRSLIYSLGILPWHWNVTLWPVVALHALLTGFVLWLVLRSILARQPAWWFLVLVALLSLLTSLSWFVSLIMPDILGAVLYLCIYLLVFARETLSRLERLGVALIAWWAIASHATHLILAAALCVLLASLFIFWRKSALLRWKAVGQVAMIVLLAAASQVALNTYLYGKPSLNGNRPPFLAARVIADGPGRWYLQQHCGEVKFALCDHLHNLPDNTDDFLWGENGIWQSASKETAQRLRHEEIPFVLATLRAYPRQLLSNSAARFWEQLTTFCFEVDANAWMLKEFDTMLLGERSRALQSRQAQNALPFDFFESVQIWTVIASLAVIVLFLPRLWRRQPPRLVGLGVVIVFAVVANAFLTGALSMVEDRYQGRVIWLLPLLACLLLLDWGQHREPAER